jgi:hypothetical protein
MKKKDTEAHKKNAAEVQDSNLDEETVEVIKAADHKKDRPSGDQGDDYRIWRCNGLPVGVRIHKKLT